MVSDFVSSDFVMCYCWLTNTTGRKDCFLPIDLLQEHNIWDIKACYFTAVFKSMVISDIAVHFRINWALHHLGIHTEDVYVNPVPTMHQGPCQKRSESLCMRKSAH